MKQDGKYTTTITASCVSEDTDAVDAALDKLVADTKLPDSVEQTKDTMDEMMTETFTAIGKAIAAAVFLVFLVMAMQFESPKYSLMVMLSIPFRPDWFLWTSLSVRTVADYDFHDGYHDAGGYRGK